MRTITHQRGGFTLIESMVAITILITAVLGPIAIIVNNIKTGEYIKNQLTASYLAQEAMEVIINHRDYDSSHRFDPNGQWLTFSLDNCVSPDVCDFDPKNYPNGSWLVACPGGVCENLYQDTGGFYGHDHSGMQTIFNRKVKISTIDTGVSDPINGLPDSVNAAKVEVTVSWANNQSNNQSFTITNYLYHR